MKFSSKIEKCGLSPMRKFAPYAVEAEKAGKKIYHLNIGQPDIATPPAYFDAVKNFSQPVLAYAPSAGIPALLEAVAGYYGKIGAPIKQRIPAAGKYLTGDANLCAMSCGMELRNQRQQARNRDDPVYGDRQIAFPAARDLSGATLGLPGGIKQRAAVVEQAAPGAGQNRSPALAFKQCEAQLRFCLANRVRHRRGNPVQVLGRGGEGALGVDGIENLQGVEGQAHR